jgi:pimeloyl-ACP methyl ester carboxylesterase
VGPILDALAPDHRAIAFDLPGHGDSPALAQPGLAAVAESIHAAVLDARLDGFHLELLPDPARTLLHAGNRPADRHLQQLVLAYQSDLLQRPLDEVVRWRDEGWDRIRDAPTPYITLHSNPIDHPDRVWLNERLPQAEIIVWPVGHHFPHLAHPARFAALLTGLAAGLPRPRERHPR